MQLWLQAPECREGEGHGGESHSAQEGQGKAGTILLPHQPGGDPFLPLADRTDLGPSGSQRLLSQVRWASSNERPIFTLGLTIWSLTRVPSGGLRSKSLGNFAVIAD